METVDYVYTGGLTETEARERLADAAVGVLALARDGEAYAIPMGHVLEGDRLYFRFGDQPDSQKVAYAAATTTATFTVYDYPSPHDSWSVVARGPIRRTDETPIAATLNERFPPFRVFDESISEVSYDIYELEIESLTGRAALQELE